MNPPADPAPEAPAPDQPQPPEDQPQLPTDQPQPPRSRYGQGTVAGIILSLIVVGAVVAVVVALVPRPSAINRPPVDVAGSAREIAKESGLPISAPQGLPEGWVPTSVRYLRSTDDLLTWHLGYTTPGDGYVALEQTADATDAWVEAQTNRARQEGTVDIAGRSWNAFAPATRDQRSILLRSTEKGGLTTLVTGKAPQADLVFFAERLETVDPQ